METSKQTIRQFFKIIVNEFLYNGHIQSLGAIAIITFSYLYSGLKINILPYTSTYILFYIIYLFNRQRELKSDSATNKERVEHILKIKNLIPYLFTLTSIIFFVILLFSNNFIFALSQITILILGVLYTTHVKEWTRIIPLLKNLYVSSVFAILVFIPLLLNGTIDRNWQHFMYMAIFIFLKSMFMQMFLDLKDTESDRKRSLKTIGTIFTRKKSIYILGALSVLTTALTYVIFNSLAFFEMLSLMLLMALEIFCLYLILKNKKIAYIIVCLEFILIPMVFTLGHYLQQFYVN